MRLQHHLEYAGMRGVAGVLRALPRPLAVEVGAGIGTLGWLLRVRRPLVLANLHQAFPPSHPGSTAAWAPARRATSAASWPSSCASPGTTAPAWRSS